MTQQLIDLASLDFEKGGGVVTVIAVDAISGAVLMVAAADHEALEQTISTGEMHYLSRTRGLWHKGETSGNIQKVVSLTPDCDNDAVLAKVIPSGPACHTGSQSCFGEQGEFNGIFREVDKIIVESMQGAEDGSKDADSSYTVRLLQDRNLRLKKLGEEAAELVVACADSDRPRCVEETSDVIFHVLVALRASGAALEDVEGEMYKRRRM